MLTNQSFPVESGEKYSVRVCVCRRKDKVMLQQNRTVQVEQGLLLLVHVLLLKLRGLELQWEFSKTAVTRPILGVDFSCK